MTVKGMISNIKKKVMIYPDVLKSSIMMEIPLYSLKMNIKYPNQKSVRDVTIWH